MRARKRRSPGQLALKFPNPSGGLRRFWQRRYYAFNIYTAKKMREKLEYMYANPIQRKLATHPRDWPWSSWSICALNEQGLVKIDSMPATVCPARPELGRELRREPRPSVPILSGSANQNLRRSSRSLHFPVSLFDFPFPPKLFRINTYEKRGGGGVMVNQIPSALNVSMRPL